MKKFIPRSETNLVPWLQNLSAEIKSVATSLGMTAADIKKLQDTSDGIVTKISNTDAARTDLKKTEADKNTAKTDGLTSIGVSIQHLMSNPNWTPAYAQALRTDVSYPQPDLSNAKPIVSAKITGGLVELRILKRGAEGMNIYTKNQSDTTWAFLERATRSRYTDMRGLAVRGVAEIRQYMVMYVMNDKEVGLPSDITTVVFAG